MKYLTVGPSSLYPTAEKHIAEALKMDICSISHRSRGFEDIFRSTTSSLRTLLGIPESHHIFFLGSATEAMERIIQNLVKEKSFHFVNGSFSGRFYKTALEQGKKPEKLEVDFGKSFDSYDVPDGVELICFTQTETSTGVSIPEERIHSVARAHPDRIVAVDIVSSVPYCRLDYNIIDCAFFSVQKGFGLPAGLGVLIASPRCIDKAKDIQGFHSFGSLLAKEKKHQTPETPNVLGIYLLGRVCEDMLSQGIAKLRNGIRDNAELVYKHLENSIYRPFPKKDRSDTVIVIEVGDSQEVIKKLSEGGFAVSSGYGPYKESQVRIANYPSQQLIDYSALLKIL